ncbi:MAG TPA: LuxR C-terminal-related transcriptional regulator [Ramlibacter sp.]|nr:LuxR C-terminal-related transcriptional regulator [Ramlibacter sp.]
MATTLQRNPIATPGDLLLKVTPPRVPRHQVARPRLQSDHPQFRDHPLVLVQAPAGFGKTSLLAQWRREHLAQGRVVAWLSAQSQDDSVRFVQGLALAVRAGAGRPTFGHTLLDAATPAGLEGVTIWLADVARSALDIVLIVDEADRLPPETREALAYLLRNTPPNLRVVVAARADCQLDIDDLVAYGSCSIVGLAQLRFQLDETIELVRGRFGAQVDRDAAARLHDLVEGWALGLQLALSVMAAGNDPQAEISVMAAQGGALRDQLVTLLLANLDPADVLFLTRIAILDLVHPDLCQRVAQSDDAGERLTRLARYTPVFAAAEASAWLRMHTLARDELRRRFAQLPADEQAQLHARAAEALAGRGLVESAARHALAAGQREAAYDLAERSLYESLMGGRQDKVLEWMARLPAEEVNRRPRLLLAVAWSLALSERHEQANQLIERLLAQPGADDALRCECALIQSGAAVYADDTDRFAVLHDPWAQNPPLADPMLLQVHANRSALRALVAGEPAVARLRQQQGPRGDDSAALRYLGLWGDVIVGLSYVWEGQVLLAEKLLRPTMARAEGDLGRRSPFVCMLAAVLAAATWERNSPDEAGALLANRLDVLERSGLPEAVLLAYRTMARMAGAEGAEHRALELLGAMDALGVTRNLPRLRIVSLVEQVRLHARRFRSETCVELCVAIDGLLADAQKSHGPLWLRGMALLREVAVGYAAIAAQDWRRAADTLSRADAMAQGEKLGRLHIELLGLRAWALDRCGEKSLPLLREAADLAATYGLLRVFDDAHPQLGDWVREALPSSPPRAAQAEPAPARERSTPSMALTPKEREVLELLSRNLSNKEIGLAMQVGEETVKWHMKNLFAKLEAGTRKHLVQRARILGLLEAA